MNFTWISKVLIGGKLSLYGIPLDHLLRPNDAGKYDAIWNSREDKINNCVIFVGQLYRYDA